MADAVGFGEVVALDSGLLQVNASRKVWSGLAAVGAPESTVSGWTGLVVSLYDLEMDVTTFGEPQDLGPDPRVANVLQLNTLSPGARFGASIAIGAGGIY